MENPQFSNENQVGTSHVAATAAVRAPAVSQFKDVLSTGTLRVSTGSKILVLRLVKHCTDRTSLQLRLYLHFRI